MTNTTYRTDFYAWTQEQAALLEAEEVEKLDLANIKEEIESMGISQRKELASRLTVLLMHLLKWQEQPGYKGRRPNSWRNTIRVQRREIDLLLVYSPSLRRQVPDFIADAYPRARKEAAGETRVPLARFPADCPWTVEEILDEDWLPS